MRRNQKSIKDLREFYALTKSQLKNVKGGSGDSSDSFEHEEWG